jgi:predicted RNA binding protein YcfA (HicA-like mRNA interferase family)
MPRLPGISQKEAVRVFQKLGYRVVRESGHLIMSNGERRLVRSIAAATFCCT